ncbi:MAG: hypothetical protein E7Y34_02560, partial [Mycoplasma sp.]|nr:hypothetical protein [Mycoplasma sp.]
MDTEEPTTLSERKRKRKAYLKHYWSLERVKEANRWRKRERRKDPNVRFKEKEYQRMRRWKCWDNALPKHRHKPDNTVFKQCPSMEECQNIIKRMNISEGTRAKYEFYFNEFYDWYQKHGDGIKYHYKRALEIYEKYLTEEKRKSYNKIKNKIVFLYRLLGEKRERSKQI